MNVYSCVDSEADLTDWGIEIPLLYNRPKKIIQHLKSKFGKEVVKEIEWELLSKRDLKLVHTDDYINSLFDQATIDDVIMNIYELKKDDGSFYRFNPKKKIKEFSDLFYHQHAETSGVYYCAKDSFLNNKNNFFLSGGMHHAMTDRGRGFCSLNDQVIAIKKLQFEYGLKSAWVIDLDVHKGDGTAECTKSDKTISTLSIHMQNGWPFDETWKPGPWDISSTVDIAINETEQESYLEKLKDGLNELQKRAPDPSLVFVADGSDPYEKDELDSSRLIKLTKQQMLERDLLVYNFLKELNVPQQWVMAGGYGEFSWEIYAQFLERVIEI
jgi:acetoin utilization deacetylase AcuC-like enzyme